MRQSRTSGSVGAPGRQRPGATRPLSALLCRLLPTLLVGSLAVGTAKAQVNVVLRVVDQNGVELSGFHIFGGFGNIPTGSAVSLVPGTCEAISRDVLTSVSDPKGS